MHCRWAGDRYRAAAAVNRERAPRRTYGGRNDERKENRAEHRHAEDVPHLASS